MSANYLLAKSTKTDSPWNSEKAQHMVEQYDKEAFHEPHNIHRPRSANKKKLVRSFPGLQTRTAARAATAPRLNRKN